MAPHESPDWPRPLDTRLPPLSNRPNSIDARGGHMQKHRIYSMSVASVYPHYVAKAEKKGRTKEEVDEIICWLTGHSRKTLQKQLAKETTFEDFFAKAPEMNPTHTQITGVVCGVRVENIEEPVMREIRYLDKLIDELARGKAMAKILRDHAGT